MWWTFLWWTFTHKFTYIFVAFCRDRCLHTFVKILSWRFLSNPILSQNLSSTPDSVFALVSLFRFWWVYDFKICFFFIFLFFLFIRWNIFPTLHLHYCVCLSFDESENLKWAKSFLEETRIAEWIRLLEFHFEV